MSDHETHVGRLPGHGKGERNYWLMMGVMGLAFLYVVGSGFAERPAGWPWDLGLLLGFPALFLCLLNLDTWLDTATGRLRHRRAWLVHWQVRWADADVVRFRSNHAGAIFLQARGPGRGRAIHVPIVADDMRGARSQPVFVLRLLAAEIRRWAPPHHHRVADGLDAQADHVERGARITDSPLLVDHSGWQLPF